MRRVLLFAALLFVTDVAEAAMLTHYAYKGDSTPDTASSNGIGAFAPFLTPHSLITYVNPETPASAGLSADMAAQYHVQPGQAFTVTGSDGTVYHLIYSDTGAAWETGRVDIYDPNNTLGGNNNFGASIRSFNNGPLLAGEGTSGIGNFVATTINMSIVDPLLQKFQTAGATWVATIKTAATWLFWILALISLAWTGFMMALKSADLMEIFAELFRFIMFTGLFFWLLTNGPVFANDIVQSFWKIGGQASGNGQAIFPADLITLGLQVFQNAVTHVNFLQIESIVVPVLIALGIMIVCVLIACNMILLLCGAWIVLYAGLIFLGFGGCRWTSDMAVNYYRTVISIGVSLMTMELIIGIGIQFLQTLVASTAQTTSAAALAGVLCASIILAVISHKIPHMVAGMAVGGGHNGAIGSIGILSLLGASFAGARLAGAVASAGAAGAAGMSAAEKLHARIGAADQSGYSNGNSNGSSPTPSPTRPIDSGGPPSFSAHPRPNSAPPPPSSTPASTTTMHVNAAPPVEPEPVASTDHATSPDESRGFEPPPDFIYPDEPA